jgi:cell wall-associated NlpC family hydrolase
MTKRIAAIGAMTLALTMCSSTTVAVSDEKRINTPSISYSSIETFSSQGAPQLMNFIVGEKARQTFLERQAAYAKAMQEAKIKHRTQLLTNKRSLKKAVDLTTAQVGKTWYVFSGSTPSGWDCSGLVLWTYAHLGIDLYHGATAQVNSGEITLKPKFGDIVGFGWNGSNKYYHVGIYISEDLMLHSGGKKGDRTELRSISNFAGKHSKVVYSRIVETPKN